MLSPALHASATHVYRCSILVADAGGGVMTRGSSWPALWPWHCTRPPAGDRRRRTVAGRRRPGR